MEIHGHLVTFQAIEGEERVVLQIYILPPRLFVLWDETYRTCMFFPQGKLHICQLEELNQSKCYWGGVGAGSIQFVSPSTHDSDLTLHPCGHTEPGSPMLHLV